jgi:tetratricopeptide (TPR) repeat protein
MELLRSYFRIQDRDGPPEIRERVAGKLLMLDRGLEALLTPLIALLNVPVDDEAWDALDPPQRRERTLEAVKQLVLRESQVQPLILLFEDFHWFDSETQSLLDGLIESLPTSRVLLLVNYRPGYEHGWRSETYFSQVRLEPLPPETAGELLEALVGDEAALSPLRRLLIERTEGNPFFLEESVRTLIETRVLVGERGAYRLARPLEDIQVPATVEAVLAARIDRLPEEGKRLLQVAAVIGQDVSFSLIRAIADLDDEALRRSLVDLRAAEFLYESSLFPEVEYTFKHALTHEVAYRGLLQERRRVLHARCMAVLEQLGTERVAEQVERLAHHAFRAEAWDKATGYLRLAGSRAIERSAYREATARFEQALVALAHLPESRERLEQAVDLRLNVRNTLVGSGSQRIFECLREAEEIATVLDDRRRLGWVSAYLAWELTQAREHTQAIERAQRGLKIGRDLKDRRLQAVAGFIVGRAHQHLGDPPSAVSVLRETVACLEGELAHERFGMAGFPSVMSRALLAHTLGELGDFAEGIAHGEEAVRTAERVDHLHSLCYACVQIGALYLTKGDAQKSIPFLERSLHLGQAGNFPFLFLAASALGHAYVLSGRIADALPLLDLCAAPKVLDPVRVSLLMTEAYLVAGRLAEASRIALHTQALTQQRRERGRHAHALRFLGEIAGRRDPPEVERAEANYRQALASAEDLSMRPLVAHCHFGLGKLFCRTGDHARAQVHLTTAAAMYREMDMGFG